MQVSDELAALGALPETSQAPVALVFDYQSYWSTMIQPQGKDFRYEELCFRWYEALRHLGLNVDFVRRARRSRVIRCCRALHDGGDRSCTRRAREGQGCGRDRCAHRVRATAISAFRKTCRRSARAHYTGNRVVQVSSMRPGLSDGVSGAFRVMRSAGANTGDLGLGARDLRQWRSGTDREGQCALSRLLGRCRAAGRGAGTGHRRRPVLRRCACPTSIRIRRRGDLVFAFNYGSEDWALPAGAEPVLGEHVLKPQAVAAWRPEIGSLPGAGVVPAPSVPAGSVRNSSMAHWFDPRTPHEETKHMADYPHRRSRRKRSPCRADCRHESEA